MPGGQTLGPIVSSYLPMRACDIGIPVLAMHSASELMHKDDYTALADLITAFSRHHSKKAATSGSLFISNQSVFTFNLVFIDQPFHPIFNDGIICVGYNFLCIGRIIRDDSIHIQ